MLCGTLTYSESQKQELATGYACMILSDCEAKVNDENIGKLLDAAKVSVEPYIPKLFSQLLKDSDKQLIEMFVASGGGGGGADGAANGGEGEGKEEEKKEEEEDDDGGFDFDSDEE